MPRRPRSPRPAPRIQPWREARFGGDEAIYPALEAWRKTEKHLYEWQANQYASVLAARLDYYRVFASRLTRRYGAVVIEALDLRPLASTPPIEEGALALPGVGDHRMLAAVSTLVAAIEQACAKAGVPVVRVEAANTTITCWSCGHLEAFDAIAELVHRCSACGIHWDQDENAARNLLARHAARERSGDGAPAGTARMSQPGGKWAKKKTEKAGRVASEGASGTRSQGGG